uniref:hypothetical protein n=1 Tax=Cytobacillus oceanisediminis TaxID=665099 RepID=UPI0037367816
MANQLLNQELESAEQTNTPESFRGRSMGGFGPGMMQAQASVETVDELNVQVNTEDLGFLALIGLLIAVVSALLPSLSVLRLQPKAILSKQD